MSIPIWQFHDPKNRRSQPSRWVGDVYAEHILDYTEEADEVGEGWRSLQALLEAAYGWLPDEKGVVNRRAAPSAGRRYPIELLVVRRRNGASEVFHYDFLLHKFRGISVEDCGNDILSGIELSGPDDVAIIVSAFPWRTIQRYGSRGYRYIHTDAGAVIANLFHIGREWSFEVGRCRVIATRDVEKTIAPDGGLWCIASLVVRGTRGIDVPRPDLFIHELTRDDPEPSSRYSPALAGSELIRKNWFNSEDGVGLEIDCPEIPLALPPDWHARRRSANRFDTCGIAETSASEAIRRVKELTHSIAEFSGLPFRAVKVQRMDGQPAQCEVLGGADTADSKIFAENRALAEIVQAHIEQQTIVAEAPLWFILALRTQDPSKMEYSIAALWSGLWASGCYKIALGLGLGTTSIGGFSDKDLSESLGVIEMQPMLMQVYGRPVDGVKIDAVPSIDGPVQ